MVVLLFSTFYFAVGIDIIMVLTLQNLYLTIVLVLYFDFSFFHDLVDLSVWDMPFPFYLDKYFFCIAVILFLGACVKPCKGSGFASSMNVESQLFAIFQVILSYHFLLFSLLPYLLFNYDVLSCECYETIFLFFLRFCLGRHALMNKNYSLPSSTDFSTHSVGPRRSSLCPSERCKINIR
jgi:hypothetical protein